METTFAAQNEQFAEKELARLKKETEREKKGL
jgi:hypothetical protein